MCAIVCDFMVARFCVCVGICLYVIVYLCICGFVCGFICLGPEFLFHRSSENRANQRIMVSESGVGRSWA